METRFVDWLLSRIPADPRLEIAGGDDAAVLRPPPQRRTVVTVDMLTEGVDFLFGPDCLPGAVGHKSLAVSLSDLAAMAARPEAAFVAVALPRTRAEEIGRGLFDGLERLARDQGVVIAGGDTNTWDGPLVISVTAIGSVAPGAAWRRDGAQVGDLLVVTGPCGGSLLGRHLAVRPRCLESLDIAGRFRVNAAIDISDGLSLDLTRLMKASRTQGVVDLQHIPVHPDAVRQSSQDGLSPLDHALSDGEDFELLLAMPAADAQGLVINPPAGLRPIVIGEVVAGNGLVARDQTGLLRPLEPKGWLHDGTG